MLVDSTATKGRDDERINPINGKKINFIMANARIKSIIQLNAESDCHKKCQIFFKFILSL